MKKKSTKLLRLFLKRKLLRDALVSVESDYIKTEVNGALCTNLIKFYKAEIKKEADKNAK